MMLGAVRIPSTNSRLSLPYLLWCVQIALLSLSLVMIYSTHLPKSYDQGSNEALCRQGSFIIVALIITFITASYSCDWLRKPLIRLIFWFFTSILLCLVFFPGDIGVTLNGSSRWVNMFGLFQMQPSEVAKFLVVLHLAALLSQYADQGKSMDRSFLFRLFPLGMIIILVMIEPDFGSTIFIVALIGAMLFIGRLPFRTIVFFIVLAAVILAVLFYFDTNRWGRFIAYLDPFAAPDHSGDQLQFSLIAISRGGFDGQGLGMSNSKLFYLSYANSDFIFSIIAEELGFIAVFAIIMLYILLLWVGFKIARWAMVTEKHFQSYLAYGVTLLLTIPALINIGVATGVLPTKGLVLPFLSQGGSSLMVCSFAVGNLISIAKGLEK